MPEPVPALYRLFRERICRLLVRHFDFRVEGGEHLPVDGPFILAANHHNYLDGVVLAAAVSRPIAFLVMPRVWRATPLHPLLHRHIGRWAEFGAAIGPSLRSPDLGPPAPPSRPDA